MMTSLHEIVTSQQQMAPEVFMRFSPADTDAGLMKLVKKFKNPGILASHIERQTLSKTITEFMGWFMTDDLVVQYSWTGRSSGGGKSNKIFKDHPLVNILLDVLSQTVLYKYSARPIVAIVIKSFF
uniref:Uncharacterized protein n=2 Tax=Ciona intestinalis TaxID=7719 RepID=F7AY81_CIOIN